MIRNLLYKRTVPITDRISVYIPTVEEVIADEDGYYSLVSLFTAMPIDYMVPLADAGVDFSTINEWQMFLMFFGGIKDRDTSLIFDGLDLSKFSIGVNEDDQSMALIDVENDIRIDRGIYTAIGNILREIHHLEKNVRKPANNEAKEYMIERERRRMRRRKNRVSDSQLESLIVAMTNTEQYKYDYEGTLELSIYQFNQSVRQIIKKVEYDNRMYGVYAGTVSVKDLSQDDLNWLTHK